MEKRVLWFIVVLAFVVYVTSFNYGGCGGGGGGTDSESGSSTSTLPTQVLYPVLPANNATNVGINILLSWSASVGAESYDVYLGTTNPPLYKANRTSGNCPSGALSYGTTYYWRIDAKNSVGVTTGNVWSFTTQMIVPDQVVPLTPANLDTGIGINTQLTWDAAGQAASYDLYFGATSSPALVTNTAITSYNVGPLSYNTVYYWKVNSKNSAGTTAGNIWHFTTQVTLPAQVVGPNPADSAANVLISTHPSWASAGGATEYDIYFGTTNPPDYKAYTASTNYSTSVLSYSTTYYWRIDSKNSGGTITGTVWSFTTEAPPPPPAQATTPNPANGAANITINGQLAWASAISATGYDVYFGTSSPPPLSQTNTSAITYNPGILAFSTTYFWRINSKNTGGTTTGNIWSFATKAPTLPAQATTPNLADGAINVSITPQLAWASAVDAASYDIYLGTSNPPTYITNTATTSYTPGALAFSTGYYWRIDSRNTAGATTGTVWTFTTRAPAPPAQATTPNPVNNATGVPITTTLNWALADGATSYDVYFGTTNPPSYITNTATTSYNPAPITFTTTYYWRIDSKNLGGTTTGVVWSFTAQSPSWSAIAVGYGHTIARKPDDSLWAWGDNNGGQLGDGTITNKNTPTRIGTATNWPTIAAASYSTIALKADGTLWAWGYNYYGQLGDGTNIDKHTPTHIGTATNWSTIATGFHTVAIKTDGTLWAWGYNCYGQLGDGTTISRTTPSCIGTLVNWLTIAAGRSHTIARKTDGSLWAWGYNVDGQLGDGTYIDKYIPTHIGTDTNWSAIDAGLDHTIALKTDGSLWAWGFNNYGQLGNGTTTGRTVPTRIGTATNWLTIAAGESHTIALKTDGTLWAWGWNSFGQLGDGTTTSKNVPTQIAGTNWSAIAGGGRHTVALKSDGSLWTWGWNVYGQLGDGTNIDRHTPTQVGQ
ncbi:MAG: hypothetical protein V1701_02280 [Planctomycetota bacterium]